MQQYDLSRCDNDLCVASNHAYCEPSSAPDVLTTNEISSRIVVPEPSLPVCPEPRGCRANGVPGDCEWCHRLDLDSEFDTCGSYAGTPCQDQEDGGCICDVARERDELRAEVASLSEQLEQVIGAGGEYMAEVERMRPVIEAAIAWFHDQTPTSVGSSSLAVAVHDYQEASND